LDQYFLVTIRSVLLNSILKLDKINYRGIPYYICIYKYREKMYYIKKYRGKPYYINKYRGKPYYINKNSGKPYYINKYRGKPYYINKYSGKPVLESSPSSSSASKPSRFLRGTRLRNTVGATGGAEERKTNGGGTLNANADTMEPAGLTRTTRMSFFDKLTSKFHKKYELRWR